MSSPGRRTAFTLVEVLFAATILFVLMGGIYTFLNTGNRAVVVAWDHAQARSDALRILEVIGEDIDRLVIDDSLDKIDWPGVLEPILLPSGENAERSTKFMFFAMHHRRYWQNSPPPTGFQKTQLVAQLVEYQVVPRQDGHGVDLHRNGVPVNVRWTSEKQRLDALAAGADLSEATFPLSDVKLQWLDQEEASRLAVSRKHAFKVTVEPLGDWDRTSKRAANLAKGAAVSRLFHLKGVESYFAVLTSLVDVDAPMILATPIYGAIKALNVGIHRPDSAFDLSTPLDWIVPPKLIVCETALFDDATVGKTEVR